MDTPAILVASIMIVFILLVAGLNVITVFRETKPMRSPVVIHSSVLEIRCMAGDRRSFSDGRIEASVISSLDVVYKTYMKNTMDRFITVDKVVFPAGSLMDIPIVDISRRSIPPGMPWSLESYATPRVGLINSTRVKPGDILVVGDMSVSFERRGVIAEYFTIPINPPSQGYTPPGNLRNNRYSLSSSSGYVSSYIPYPGYASTRLCDLPDSFFIVSSILRHQYDSPNENDVFFYIDFFGASRDGLLFRYGFPNLARVHRLSNNIHLTSFTPDSEKDYGVFVEENKFVFIDELSRRTFSYNRGSGQHVLHVGLGRNGTVASEIAFKAYISDNVFYYVVFNYVAGSKWYFYNQSQYVEGSVVFVNLTGANPVLNVTNGFDSPIVIVKNTDMNMRTGGWVLNHTRGRNVVRYDIRQLSGNIVDDYIILWEDQYNPFRSIRGDDWRDHVVRVTLFANGTGRLAVLTAKGNFKHEFYNNVTSRNPLSGSVAYVKNYFQTIETRDGSGKVVENQNYVYSSRLPGYIRGGVRYLGVFRSTSLVLKNLTQGDIVILSTPRKTVSFIAHSTNLTIDLVDALGLRNLVSALRTGGVSLIIYKGLGQLLLNLPSESLIHASGENIDYWVRATNSFTSSCTPVIYLHGEENYPLSLSVSILNELVYVVAKDETTGVNYTLIPVQSAVISITRGSYEVRVLLYNGGEKILSGTAETRSSVKIYVSPGEGVVINTNEVYERIPLFRNITIVVKGAAFVTGFLVD